MATAVELNAVSNDGRDTLEMSLPYIVQVTIEGASAFLFHRWSVDGVAAKAKAAKGSRAKKEDDTESYLYRNEDGSICLPSEYLRMSIINAARYRQDPRSPRKSAMDLFKAAIVGLEELCVLTNKLGEPFTQPEYIDRRRVTVQRNGLTRHRPALHSGWKSTVPLMCNLPEYVTPQLLNEVVQSAGRLIGVGDFRPTFGRFVVTEFKQTD